MSRPQAEHDRSTTAKRRWAMPALTFGLVLTTVWAGGASYYLLCRDPLIGRFTAQQTSLRAAYEARLAEMTARLERVTADKGETSSDVEARLATLAERLSGLESRQSALSALTGSTRPLYPDPESTGALPDPNGLFAPASGYKAPGRRSEAFGLSLAAAEGAADAVAAAQVDGLARLGDRSRHGVERLRSVLSRTGLALSRFKAPQAGIGGPLVPVSADAFEDALARTRRDREDEARLRKLAAGLPLGRPLFGDLALSSTFGTRLDPFTRGLAMHTGIDLKAEMWSSATATAAGRVISAEPAGGYGNLVEIDHGNGITTRYAHLASFSVRPGQWVPAGGIVGLVGSTGRSTGSHLHYETRVDGEPVNPLGFLEAGAEYAALRLDEAR